MRVLVTGASGFVGTHLTRRLDREGCEIVARDRELDVADPVAIEQAISAERPDAIAHLAALSFVPDSVADPWRAYRVNFLGTRNVLRAVRTHAPAARLLAVSSAAVYGSQAPDAEPFHEQAPLAPASPYARTKAAGDRLTASAACDGANVVTVRPFNHSGRGRPDHFAESSFARQLVEIERGERAARLEVGNLEAIRDYLHVEDVVDAYWRLLQPDAPVGVFNVASGRGVTLQQIVEGLCERTSQQPEIEVMPDRWRPTDAARGDASRLKRATNWMPKHDVGAILDELVEAWRAELQRSGGSPRPSRANTKDPR